jgi:hypothetical protein
MKPIKLLSERLKPNGGRSRTWLKLRRYATSTRASALMTRRWRKFSRGLGSRGVSKRVLEMPKGEEAGSFQRFRIFETRRFLADRRRLGKRCTKAARIQASRLCLPDSSTNPSVRLEYQYLKISINAGCSPNAGSLIPSALRRVGPTRVIGTRCRSTPRLMLGPQAMNDASNP